MRLGIVAACLAASLAACFPGPECGPQGGECGGDYVCADTHECLPPDQVRRVQIRWTIEGQAPDATVCDSMGDLSLTVRSRSTEDARTYAPVPCFTGLFTFSALPTIFDEATLIMESTGANQTLPIPAGGGDVDFQL